MVVAAAATFLAGSIASAQSPFPSKPVHIFVPYAAGGAVDILARTLGDVVSRQWGQSVVVENRPGAGGNLGAAAAAQAAPDGYTLHLGAQTLAVNPTIAPYQGFDPIRDFEPIILVATAQDVLMVAPDSPYHSVQDLIADAKKHPGELNYASFGVGTSAHLASVLFAQVAGIKLQHVPYPTGIAQAVTDIMSGRIAMWLATLGGALGNVQAGKMRALAVSGPARAPALPDVPTFKELGLAMEEESTWFGFFAPKGTPKDVIAKVNGDVERILAQDDVKARGVTLGFRYIGASPDKLAAFLKNETAKWAEVAKKADLVAH
jgi:tripartite-type tricarboxylate transporter receptor subunit TctC